MTLRRRLFLKSLALLLAAVPGLGCTRQFFRKQADKDVEKLLTEKNVFEPWRIEQWHVYPDPRARFADPTDPDHPPKPPDDPAARYLSPNPQRARKAGVGLYEGTGYLELLGAWDAMNRAEAAPELQPVPAGEKTTAGKTSGVKLAQYVTTSPCDPVDKTFLIKLEQSSELGLINSREFQDQRENLYLAALPVSLQRYSFAAQFFATGDANYETSGTGNRFTGGSSVGFRKLFPTGATLLAQAANNFVFNLGGGQPQVSVSTLTLDLLQPLLRGGGRAVTLEPLTQAERNLLYQIRDYARFRKQFFVSLAGGQAGQLNGLGANALADPTLGFSATGGLVSNRGFLPTLRFAANIDVERQNIRALEGFLRRFEAYAEGGQVSQLQVDQIKQTLLQSQSTLLQTEQSLRSSLDSFKLQLGLPPTLGLELDRSAIKPVTDQLARFEKVLTQFRSAQETVEEKYGAEADVPLLRARLRAILTEGELVQATAFRATAAANLDSWAKLSNEQLAKRLSSLRETRRQRLAERSRLEAAGQPVPKDLTASIAGLDSELRFGEMERALREYEGQPWKRLANPDVAKRRQASMFNEVANAFELVFIDARNQRFTALQQQWPDLPRACVEGVDLVAAPLQAAYTRSAQTALANRLDLMNARAQLVDDWRQIAVRANSLLGVLNIGYNVQSTSPAGAAQPFNFSADHTTQRLTLHGELPLVRRLERNNYRTALINFQRSRRTLQSTEDNLLVNLRNDLGQLRISAENYKIQQQQVALAYASVENSLEQFSQPDLPAAGGGVLAPPAGAAAASLTQQLLGAQASLLRAQELLFQVWIGYLTQRMTLYLDLELLPLDARGVWIDDHATRDCDAACLPASGPLPRQPAGETLPPPHPAAAEPGSVQWRARSLPPEAAKR